MSSAGSVQTHSDIHVTALPSSPHGYMGGRGRGRGRGGRGRGGRGRGGLPTYPSRTVRKPNLRPTHFLSIPLGQHPSLRSRISAFQNALLQATPAIPGLDSSIVIDPRRLHLTLGVMALDPELPPSNDYCATPGAIPLSHQRGSQENATHQSRTLTTALALLRSLKSQITEALFHSEHEQHSLCVPLNRMDTMKPVRGDVENAHVLWVGPDLASEEGRRLRGVCDLVYQKFRDAGFIVDRRPLLLHCTVLNTSHRKPRGTPFSYSGVLESSSACQLVGAIGPSSTSPPGALTMLSRTFTPNRSDSPSPDVTQSRYGPVAVNLGVWDVNEIQLCVMGSHGPDNEYISCGGITLT